MSFTTLAETDERSAPVSSQQFVCPLCCEDSPAAGRSVVLTACYHQGCRTCMAKWIKKQEVSGRVASPTCPFCRSDIHDDEVLTILGRSFKRQNVRARPDNEDMDELTLQWLTEQTQICPGCGSRVEKLAGCNHMTCLCGCEFCFGCGGVQCRCVGGGRTYSAAEEPIRHNNGVVNLRACMQRRNRNDVRSERFERRYDAMAEEDDRWTNSNRRPCYSCNGRWLFSCRKSRRSETVLIQQCNATNVRRHRREKRRTNQNSIFVHPYWLFDDKYKGLELKALHMLFCNNAYCDVCHGTEEERESQNLQNVQLLF